LSNAAALAESLGGAYSTQRANFETAFRERFGGAYADVALKASPSGRYDIAAVNDLMWFYDQGRIDEADYVESIIAGTRQECGRAA